jgi:ATP-dependent DNA helicase RecQ
MWPTGLAALDVPLSGKISVDLAAAGGRVVARLTDIGWWSRLRELLAQPDQGVPEDVFGACVRVLAAWDWSVRPAAVVTIESQTRPELVRDLGSRLAAVGRLPVLGEVAAGGGGGHPPNSARRVAQLWPGLSLDDDLVTTLSTVGGPVLLVDDLVDSGWTMTLAARLLRQAGASGVLPFALAVVN